MKSKILECLKEIEINNDIKIIYACESGSRAWGFPSKNSDYDVRFLYVRKFEDYLNIRPDTRNVIDDYKKQNYSTLAEENNLDITGWDYQKALWLLYKSNPPLMEWLSSPIVYLCDEEIISTTRKYVKDFYIPEVLKYHYYHMAKTNFREYLKGDEVWIKKYFYVMRPLLALEWLCNHNTVPTEFSVLVNAIITSPELREAINNLIALKLKGDELKKGPRIKEIDDYINRELENFKPISKYAPSPPSILDILNCHFQDTLTYYWR